MVSCVCTLCKGNVRLHRQLGKRQRHARKHVDYDLLADAGVDAAAEDDVAAQQACEEGVVGIDFAVVEVREGEHGGLVDEGEEGEVAGVLAGGFEDEV